MAEKSQKPRHAELVIPWLLLIHQIPPKPDYFRVKIWRRLQKLGAVPIKNSVYVLPNSEQAQEDFQWTLREIISGGGEAMVCGASLIEGLTNEEVRKMFQEARDREYTQISENAKKLATVTSRKSVNYEKGAEIAAQLARLKRHLAEVAATDFFAASSRGTAESAVASVEALLRPPKVTNESHETSRPSGRNRDFHGRVWVTRKGIHVDRMASAWLIRRFIDDAARFKFVSPEGYRPQPGELRFDMFEAEFTHVGNRCTFEVLCDRFISNDAALGIIAEIVHDIDLKESKYGREETPGIRRLIAGIAMNHKEDEDRLPRGRDLFDDLYECFRKQPDSLRPRASRRTGKSSPASPRKM